MIIIMIIILMIIIVMVINISKCLESVTHFLQIIIAARNAFNINFGYKDTKTEDQNLRKKLFLSATRILRQG